MILLRLSYCVSAWSQASPSVVKHLERLYNHALKTSGKRLMQSHHCDVLGDLNMLSLNNYIALSNINLIHKCLHRKAPQALCELIQPMSATGRSTRDAAAGNPTEKHPLASLHFVSRELIRGIVYPPSSRRLVGHGLKQFKGKLEGFLKAKQI